MGKLDGKVAIITGAAGGIGAATTRLFVEEGASVMMVDLDEEQLAAVADDIGSDKVAIQAADVSDADQVQAYIDATVDAFGGLDILFANAGTEGVVKPLTEVEDEEFQRVLDVNLKGAWYGIKYAAPRMLERGGGSIVLTSSVAGMIGAAGLGPYCSSKHAVNGLMKSAAQELGPQGIRVNTVNPGPVDNRMMESIEEQASPDNPQAVRDQFAASIPMGRYATNEEIAQMTLFLASDDSSYCNGSTYLVDGGRQSG
jgi:NAD(P)-dependent dehydrogenase (short-subunit alcohol dehydrogenase family)